MSECKARVHTRAGKDKLQARPRVSTTTNGQSSAWLRRTLQCADPRTGAVTAAGRGAEPLVRAHQHRVPFQGAAGQPPQSGYAPMPGRSPRMPS